MSTAPKFNLTAAYLFGNDAAEDEDEEIFLGYVVDRPELQSFLDPSKKICIARAFKGEGKSALLRLVQSRLGQGDAPLILPATGKQLSPTQTAADTDAWVRDWKRSILGHVAREIGARVGSAWSDDTISLVEEAERAGFKSRNIISTIFDRLRTSAVPISRERPHVRVRRSSFGGGRRGQTASGCSSMTSTRISRTTLPTG